MTFDRQHSHTYSVTHPRSTCRGRFISVHCYCYCYIQCLTGPGEGDEAEEDGAGEEHKKGGKKGKIKESGAKEDGQVTEEADEQMKKKKKKGGAGEEDAEDAEGKEGAGGKSGKKGKKDRDGTGEGDEDAGKSVYKSYYRKYFIDLFYCSIIQPFGADYGLMGTASSVPERAKPSFVTFDIRALCRSGL